MRPYGIIGVFVGAGLVSALPTGSSGTHPIFFFGANADSTESGHGGTRDASLKYKARPISLASDRSDRHQRVFKKRGNPGPYKFLKDRDITNHRRELVIADEARVKA